ncbi:hypothetical protein MYFR107205_14120 [Mycolicibacterium frederiksbergense]
MIADEVGTTARLTPTVPASPIGTECGPNSAPALADAVAAAFADFGLAPKLEW